MVFKKFRLLGYYVSDHTKLKDETEYPQEAKELSSLLKKSFENLANLDKVDISFVKDFFEYVFIFKDEDEHIFAYYPKKCIARITDVSYNKSQIKIVNFKYKNWFTPGESFSIIKSTENNKYTLKVERIINVNGFLFYEVIFNNAVVHIKLYPFEVQLLARSAPRKEIVCIYLGISEDGSIRLVQDRASIIDELFEIDTTHNFTYLKSQHDNKSDYDYHILKDGYGLTHRFYHELPEDKLVPGTLMEFWIKSIHPETKVLNLIYADSIDEYAPKVWFPADKIFDEIGEADNRTVYFDDLIDKAEKRELKALNDLYQQYQEENNLWVFTYMNYIDNILVSKYIKNNQLEELRSICIIMVKLQKWMAEGSKYLDYFNKETRTSTLLKSKYQITKYERIIKAIELIRSNKQGEYIQDIVNALQKSGRLVFNKEERIDILIEIMRIYPEYIMQNMSDTVVLFKSLIEADGTLITENIKSIIFYLEHHIDCEIKSLRKTSFRTNDIDLTQTITLRNVMTLIGIKILILINNNVLNELNLRSEKAKFFRFLSYTCPKDIQPIAYKCGINSLVGTLDDSTIFTWNNIKDFNLTKFCQQAGLAPTFESNTDNDFCYFKDKGKSGLIWLCSTGFVIIPHKHCITYFKRDLSLLESVRVIHNLESFPLKIGTMLPISEISFSGLADKDYELWTKIAKNPQFLRKENDNLPPVGERILVQVKAQSQNDNLKDLLFVTSIDNRFTSIDGAIYVKEISNRYIADCRKIYQEGDIFFANVMSIKDGKLSLSIKERIDQEINPTSNITDDLCRILQKKTIEIDESKRMNNNFIHELILLIDNRIRKETSKKERELLIGYAYNLSTLISDPKSFYYNFMLRYYASVEQFNSNLSGEITIPFVEGNILNMFPGVKIRRKIIDLLSKTSSLSHDSFCTLIELANNADKIVMNFTSLLLSYMYAQKGNASENSISEIKKDINAIIENPDKINLIDVIEDVASFEELNQQGKEEIEKDKFVKTIIIETKENVEPKTKNELEIDDLQKESACFDSTINLNFFDDKTLSLSKTKLDVENLSNRIEIEPYTQNGIIIIITKDGELLKLPVNTIKDKKLNQKYECPINPYRIGKFFVVPTDCYIGMVYHTSNEIEIFADSTANIPDSSFVEANLKTVSTNQILKMQPFILPIMEDIQLNLSLRKSISVDKVDSQTIELLESFGVFIS